ncbi:hypothetical protein INR49_019023 [Caranx melampygus]|nr:hypothetical protein INR49_019023 [Caranx melampygus]
MSVLVEGESRHVNVLLLLFAERRRRGITSCPELIVSQVIVFRRPDKYMEEEVEKNNKVTVDQSDRASSVVAVIRVRITHKESDVLDLSKSHLLLVHTKFSVRRTLPYQENLLQVVCEVAAAVKKLEPHPV